jgi:hypothetical protein
VEHVQHLSRPFPWRAATLVVGGVALLELVALLVVGATRLAPTGSKTAASAPAKAVAPSRPVVKPPPAPPSHPLRPRAAVRVLVLNGNGSQGAAGREAATLQGRGYRIGGAANAPRHDYARSMVMYVPGWAKEARRLGRETGIRLVTPVDGLTPRRLNGSRVVLLLGS